MKRKNSILIIIFIVAFIGVLFGFSKKTITEFPKVQLDSNIVEDYSFSENGGAISTYTTLYYINKDHKIFKMSAILREDLPFNNIQSICAGKDGYTILGYCYPTGSAVPDEAVIVTCDTKGKNMQTVWSADSQNNPLVKEKGLVDLKVENGTIYLLAANHKELIISKPLDEEEQVVPVYADTDTEFIQDALFGESTDEVFLQNRFAGIRSLCVSTGELTECPDKETLKDTWSDTDEKYSFSYSTGLILFSLYFYLSCLLMMVLLIYVIIKLIRNGALKKTKSLVFICLAIATAVVFFVGNVTSLLSSSSTAEITSAARSSAYSLKTNKYNNDVLPAPGETIEAFFSKPSAREAINHSQQHAKEFAAALSGEHNYFFKIFVIDKNNNAYVYVDSNDEEPCGSKPVYCKGSDIIEQAGTEKVHKLTLDDGVYRYAVEKIETDSTTYGIYLLAGTDAFSDVTVLKDEIMYLIYQFIALILTIYIALEFFSNTVSDIGEYRKKRKLKDVNAGISLANIFIFAVEIVLYLDYFLLVMVTADICEGVSASKLALMLALPLTAYRLGSWLGSAITGFITSKIGSHRATLLASAGTIAAFLMMATACMIKNIYLLSIAKFIQGVFLESVLFTLADGLPYRIDDDEEREKRIASCQSANVAGIVIAIMVGGIVSEFVSYSAMYIIGAVMSVAFILIAFLVFGKGFKEDEDEDAGKTSGVSPWLAFTRPKVLVFLIVVLIPLVLLQGYEDYLFPLFSESRGVSDIVLSSIGVIANAAAYYGEKILTVFENVSRSLSIVISMCICGAALVMFMLNSNLLWAVIVLLIINIMMRVIDANKVMYIADLSKDEGFNPLDIQERFYAIEDGLRSLQAPVIGAFASITSAFACVIVGILNLILPGGYEWFTRRKNKKE